MYNKKNLVAAILLTLLLGPFGLYYATVIGGIIMTIIVPAISFLVLRMNNPAEEISYVLGLTAGALFLYSIVIWPACIIWAVISVTIHNKKVTRKEYQYLETLAKINNIEHYQNNGNAEMLEWFKENPNKGMNDYYASKGKK
ncbi:hypothetical protein CAP35_06575 [Chitinophagaceae bacterium IBVUCB1]|nr:hypothetical protein CAP35_06575 [Chitinophagaceae bacterium IBVUCB1]